MRNESLGELPTDPSCCEYLTLQGLCLVQHAGQFYRRHFFFFNVPDVDFLTPSCTLSQGGLK